MHRVSAESVCTGARRARPRHRGRPGQALGRADLVDEHIGDEPVSPLPPRVAVRAAQHKLPVGLVAALDVQLRSQAAGDRLDEVIDEVGARSRGGRLAAARRADRADRRVAGAPERADREPLLDDGRRAARPRRAAASAARRGRSTRRSPGARRELRRRAPSAPVDLDALRDESRRARVERGGAAAARALRRGGRAAAARDPGAVGRRRVARRAAASTRRAQERIREVVRIVQETGVGEITIEEDGMRVSVRRTAEPTYIQPAARAAGGEPAAVPAAPRADALVPRREPDGGHVLPRARAGRGGVRRRSATRSRPARRSASSRR